MEVPEQSGTRKPLHHKARQKITYPNGNGYPDSAYAQLPGRLSSVHPASRSLAGPHYTINQFTYTSSSPPPNNRTALCNQTNGYPHQHNRHCGSQLQQSSFRPKTRACISHGTRTQKPRHSKQFLHINRILKETHLDIPPSPF
ncbi:hypothetical protein PCANC_09555 [Puccinia coronata f. sp. avenae]|uniref:Uncharacterized protein n=1 Tax=Puccinia coronata f. sp. avenae TaxID=200324 RepID=A0A2N5S2U3_9BASI|nr:hypothetical protein PCASD_26313 [Puccinia coronata f. sp. avenae]PLW07568.1 hypothetical protein PCANC_27138 [Puccinia coronata f. sp. avenae]PLW34806.1 hypothetical protein PCASD_12664 [Puccinia coronata f. sp. avenae]PLW45075.1 hypothetical protein PCANC_09555 [Puccinia coronata f. sp. avenae]